MWGTFGEHSVCRHATNGWICDSRVGGTLGCNTSCPLLPKLRAGRLLMASQLGNRSSSPNRSRFLNRLLGLPVGRQNLLFQVRPVLCGSKPVCHSVSCNVRLRQPPAAVTQLLDMSNQKPCASVLMARSTFKPRWRPRSGRPRRRARWGRL